MEQFLQSPAPPDNDVPHSLGRQNHFTAIFNGQTFTFPAVGHSINVNLGDGNDSETQSPVRRNRRLGTAMNPFVGTATKISPPQCHRGWA